MFQGRCASFVLASLLIGAWSFPAASQTKSGQRKTPKRQVLTELVVTPNTAPVKMGQATVSYIAEKNLTVVGVSLVVLSQPEENVGDLWVGFAVDGNALAKPAIIEFRLTTGGPSRGIFKGPAVFSLTVAERVYKLDHVQRKRGSSIALGLPEQLTSGNMPFAQFEEMAASGGVEVRVGSLRFPLRDGDHAAMRDLLKAAAGASLDK